MNRKLKLISSNPLLKCFACILGIILWLKYSNPTVQCSLQIPLSFYHLDERVQIEAPEHIAVTLQGKRADFYLLDINKCAIHLDAQDLKSGINQIHITEHDIYLPETIAMLNYSPSSVSVTIR